MQQITAILYSNRHHLRNNFFLLLLAFIAGCGDDYRENNSAENAKTSVSNQNNHFAITLSAKPDSMQLDAAETAVLVVDMENDFCSKGGLMDRVGAKISVIQSIVEPTRKLLLASRNVGIPIIYLKMAYQADLSDLGATDPMVRSRFYGIVGDTMQAPNGTVGRLLVRDTWNTEIIPELKPFPDDIILDKTRFSGFFKTKLDSVLKSRGIKNIIVTGCTTSVCIESTVRDAMFLDYRSIVMEDCTAEPDGINFLRNNHDASLFIIQSEFGWVAKSENIINAIQKKTNSGKP